MTAYTSSTSGNWNAAATWGGAGYPVDGDTCVIASGHTITITADAACGVQTGTTIGVDVLGTNSTTYGKLVLNTGCTLTMKGVSSTYPAMRINRYAQFVPAAGSTIVCDNSIDCQAGILNRGIINAIGSAGSYITFTTPSANRSWAKEYATVSVPTYSSWWPYDDDRSIACVRLPKTRISNAAGTDIGSVSDSSLSITAVSPSGICTTAVSSISAVDGIGDYYLDHATGNLYFYYDYDNGSVAGPSVTLGNISTPAFKYLDDTWWRGWYIDSGGSATYNNVDYNEAKFDYCIFEYMGSRSSSVIPAIRFGWKGAGYGANRQAYVTNSIMRWCPCGIQLRAPNNGSADTPIEISGNTFYENSRIESPPATVDAGLSQSVNFGTITAGSTSSYINVRNNLIYARTFIDATIYGNGTDTRCSISNALIADNTHYGGESFYRDFTPPGTCWPDSTFSGNTSDGTGLSTNVGRGFLDIRGTSGHPVTVSGNTLTHYERPVIVNAYADIKNNLITHAYNSAFAFGVGAMNFHSGVTIQNNVVFGKGSRRATPPAYETYSNRGFISLASGADASAWIDDWNVSNNTFVGGSVGNLMTLGDSIGSTPITTLLTRIRCFNNIMVNGSYSITNTVDTSTQINRGGLAQCDNNLFYNQSPGGPSNLNTYINSTFLNASGDPYNLDTGRNVLGVELWNPEYTSAQSGRTLALTVTDAASNVTLQWGSGDAEQVVWQSTSTLTASASLMQLTWNMPYKVRMTDTSKSWSTTAGAAGCPRGRWVKFTSGAASGKFGIVVLNTATTLDFQCTWINDTLPSSGDSYVIYNAQMELHDTAGGTGNSVQAGIDLRYLPASTTSDTGITLVIDRSVSGDPELVNPLGLTDEDYKTSATGAGVQQGFPTGAPALDYWSTVRSTTTPDIGFYESGTVPSAPGGFHFFW